MITYESVSKYAADARRRPPPGFGVELELWLDRRKRMLLSGCPHRLCGEKWITQAAIGVALGERIEPDVFRKVRADWEGMLGRKWKAYLKSGNVVWL